MNHEDRKRESKRGKKEKENMPYSRCEKSTCAKGMKYHTTNWGVKISRVSQVIIHMWNFVRLSALALSLELASDLEQKFKIFNKSSNKSNRLEYAFIRAEQKPWRRLEELITNQNKTWFLGSKSSWSKTEQRVLMNN